MGYLFVLPAFLFICIFLVYPLINGLTLSFFQWDGFTEKVFIGLKNYIDLVHDEVFFLALKNTVIYMILTVAILIIIGFTLAVIIDLKIAGWKIYRFSYFLPAVLSSVVVAFLWLTIYQPHNGLLNQFLELLHLDSLQQQWLGNPRIALYCIIITVVWQWSGLTMLFFLAAMQQINQDVYDAGKIDGVSIFGRIFKITLPMIKDQFILIVLLFLIDSAKVFDIVWVMTQGGPGNATQVFGTYLYYQAFRFGRYGYSSLIAVIVFLLSFIFGIVYLNYSKFQRIEKK